MNKYIRNIGAGLFLAVILAGCGTLTTPVISTNPATGQTVTNGYVVNTNAIAGIVGTGQTLAATAAAVYPPSIIASPIFSGVGWLLTLIAGGLAAYQTNKATGLNSTVTSIVGAVEGLPSNIAPMVKTAVYNSAVASGTQSTLAPIVQANTVPTPAPAVTLPAVV